MAYCRRLRSFTISVSEHLETLNVRSSEQSQIAVWQDVNNTFGVLQGETE
jgi:hypothetical protein